MDMTQWETATDLTARLASGTAELLADPHHPHSWTLVVDGVSQSYVDLSDPTRLEMMYVRMVASVIDAVAPAGRPLRVLHLGAGGLTLPRYVAATRPGSPQLVVELDRSLLEFVQFGIPLPADSGISLRVDDARSAVEALEADQYDLIITDVYQAARMPTRVAGTAFVEQISWLLAPGGLYLVNVLDAAGLVLTRRQLATVRTGFARTCLLTTPGMWKGRRDGNVVIVATDDTGVIPTPRIQAAARPRLDLSVQEGEPLDRFLSGTAALVG
jgi:spermidine synthase